MLNPVLPVNIYSLKLNSRCFIHEETSLLMQGQHFLAFPCQCVQAREPIGKQVTKGD